MGGGVGTGIGAGEGMGEGAVGIRSSGVTAEIAWVMAGSLPPPYFFDASSPGRNGLSLPEILHFKTRQ